MIITLLGLLGLMFGSFVNALVWRLHEQEKVGKAKRVARSAKAAKTNAQRSTLNARNLSILKGHSMCPNCHHTLASKDLVPVLSWIELRGRCRYCQKKISWQYPLVELATAGLFMVSYIWWPTNFGAAGNVNFILWLVMLVGFMALVIYDLRWLTLPNRIVYPLVVAAAAVSIMNLTIFHGGVNGLEKLVFALLIASGFFYLIFQISKGNWIGGGDVKLGFLLGLLLPTPALAFLTLFTASLLGTVVILPGLASKKLTKSTHIPFGPFLITAAVIVKLFGTSLIVWYKHKFLLY